MITSMTGYGRGEATRSGVAVVAELRSVNSRFLEIASRLPRSLSLREGEIREIIRKRVTRGKISVSLSVERGNSAASSMRINPAAAREYYRVLGQLRKTLKLRESVKLDHLLRFSDVIEVSGAEETDEREWEVSITALDEAITSLIRMRRNEGEELRKDFVARVTMIGETLTVIERLSREQVPQERTRLRERIRQILDTETVDEHRLEVELALLADRLDVTEECVRFRSHNKFFLEALDNDEAAGRKLNFLIQEMNREANTIGSKSSSSDIAHRVVGIKEELEKIREQLQNVE